MRGRSGRILLAVPLVVLALAGCRDPGPSPAPSPTTTTTPGAAPTSVSGLRVAVVLPPATATTPASAEAVRSDLDRLRQRFDGDVAALRVVQPDTPAFVADVTDLVADRGADLVCVVGPGAGAVVLSVAVRYPETEFCATPATAEPSDIPANVLLIDVRVEELAFLAGVAAHLADPRVPPGFVAGEAQYAVDRQRAAFLAGVDSVAAEPASPYLGFSASDAERAFALASSQYEAGVAAIYSAAGAGDPGVLRAAEEAGRLVIGPRRTLAVPDRDDGELPAAVLMTTDVVVTAPIALAVRRRLEAWEGGRASVGLADDALVVGPGGSPRYAAVAAAVEAARSRIESGELVPLAAP